jgi:hypothetical protein
MARPGRLPEIQGRAAIPFAYRGKRIRPGRDARRQKKFFQKYFRANRQYAEEKIALQPRKIAASHQ